MTSGVAGGFIKPHRGSVTCTESVKTWRTDVRDSFDFACGRRRKHARTTANEYSHCKGYGKQGQQERSIDSYLYKIVLKYPAALLLG